MSRDAALVLGLIAFAATWALSHLLLLWAVARAGSLPGWQRALAFVPLATPVIGARAGARKLLALWLTCGAGYVALRMLG